MVTIDSLLCRYSIEELENLQKNIREDIANKFYKCDIRALGVYKALVHLLHNNPHVQLDAVILSLNETLKDNQKKYYDMALQGKNSPFLFKQSPNNILSSLLAIALNKQIHTVTIFTDDLTNAYSYVRAYENVEPQTVFVCAVEKDDVDITAMAELIFLQKEADNPVSGFKI